MTSLLWCRTLDLSQSLSSIFDCRDTGLQIPGVLDYLVTIFTELCQGGWWCLFVFCFFKRENWLRIVSNTTVLTSGIKTVLSLLFLPVWVWVVEGLWRVGCPDLSTLGPPVLESTGVPHVVTRWHCGASFLLCVALRFMFPVLSWIENSQALVSYI